MFWRRGYTLRGEVGGGWALEFPSFLGPVKWHRADRRVPFGAFNRCCVYVAFKTTSLKRYSDFVPFQISEKIGRSNTKIGFGIGGSVGTSPTFALFYNWE